MAGSSTPGQPKTIVLAIDVLRPADVARLLERVAPVVASDGRTVLLCDVGRLNEADLETVDALARLALHARRLGCSLRLRDASPALRDLVAFAGLDDVLPNVHEVRRRGGRAVRTAGRTARCPERT